jgi:hypothetical protein
VTTGQQKFEWRTRLPLETKTPSQLVYSAIDRNIPKSSHLLMRASLIRPYIRLRKMLFS